MPESSYLSSAVAIVQEAGRIARDGFGRSTVLAVKEGGDPVTTADVQIERHVVSSLAKLYPEHGFITEEAADQNAGAEFVWILDPIDGTRYYCRGIPLYSVSLALRRGTELVLGIVFSPQNDQLFTASQAEPAQLNGTPIHVSSITDLADCTICVEVPHRGHSADLRRQMAKQFARLVERCGRVRVLGISALDLCYCAAGGFDAYVRLGAPTKIWDVSAGGFILARAGATITEVAQSGMIVGAAAALHDQLLELLEPDAG